MLRITSITSDPKQRHSIFLPDGTQMTLELEFMPLQFGWFITRLEYEDFILQGVRICNSPNILIQFINKLPFGLACFSTDNREPSLQQDFVSGASILYILTAEEAREYLEFVRA